MRALCEHCHSAQPADWRAGDLCVQCGEVVRRERRCHWCARLTPIGKFCRHCGSGLVTDALYGAARMLKAGGVDQFSLPERLEKLPPDQLEHFSRLYAPHERAEERHVDDLAFVEGFLRGRGWSGALEDLLLPQLPLTENGLHALSFAPAQGTTDLERLAEIRDGSPFETSAQLAALARVRLAAPRNTEDANAARAALASSDAGVRAEAALALGNWRYVVGAPYAVQVHDLERGLLEVYTASRSPEAGLALTLLKGQYANVWGADVPPETLEALLGGEDSDLAFGAALALGHTERLLSALRIPERRYAAAITLARSGEGIAEIGAVLPTLQPHEQARVLDQLRYRVGAVPQLHDAILGILETTADHSLKRTAAALLALENRPEDALRLIQADASLTDAVLSNPALGGSELERILVQLLQTERFNMFGLRALQDIATRGRVSDAFVPGLFGAADERGWQELGSFARLQLIARGDQNLHRFLWRVLEGPMPLPARQRAWQALDGWYSHGDALRPALEAARSYFGGVAAFVERVCIVLERPRVLGGLHRLDEFLARVLSDVNDDLLPAMLEGGALLTRLRRNLWALAGDTTRYSSNRVAALHLLGRLAVRADDREALEDEVRALFLTDPLWDVRRAGLEVLNAVERERLMGELHLLLETPLSNEHRELARTLLGDLEGLMRQHQT